MRIFQPFICKGLQQFSTEVGKEIEFLLNNRPRKCLGFKTPAQVFLEQSVALAN